jgi:periplasmic divalent cation tolerance protein
MILLADRQPIAAKEFGQTVAWGGLDPLFNIRCTSGVNGTTEGMRLILSTFADEESAVPAIRSLLDEGLIACGSLMPGVRSIYRWRGNIEKSVQVILKTTAEKAARCMARLTELHPYEVPEIVEVEPSSVGVPYALWIRETLSRGE